MKRIGLMAMIYALASPAIATVSSDLDHFMDNLGYASNTTNPQAFQSQASGYYGVNTNWPRWTCRTTARVARALIYMPAV